LKAAGVTCIFISFCDILRRQQYNIQDSGSQMSDMQEKPQSIELGSESGYYCITSKEG